MNSDSLILADLIREVQTQDGCIPVGESAQLDITHWILSTPAYKLHEYSDQGERVDIMGRILVTDWNGPYTLRAEDAIKGFFQVEDLQEITQQMVAEARRAYMTPQRVIYWLAKADAVQIDGGPLIHDWNQQDITGDSDNEFLLFSWESEGDEYTTSITEGACRDAVFEYNIKALVLPDSEGNEVTIMAYNLDQMMFAA